ncbi:MAG TPA: TIGR03016 family PEP-CTERM system-associated outer membrane protein [Geobacteraceae bacterium]|nr:TIGR03016 family PEP-CTERM system-associated outer membrane protein [Geobacteraceae bacterium]
MGADQGAPDLSNGHNVVAAVDYQTAAAGLPASADDKVFNPSIAASEEFIDNVYGTPNGRKADFITHLTPGLEIKYKAPFWDWDLAYLLDYVYFARHSMDYMLNHNINLTGNMRIIRDLLFLDLTDTYKKVSLDINRDTTVTSSFVNQADQNILLVAPHVELHPFPNMLLSSGYHYRKESYLNSTTTNATTYAIDKEEHGGFIKTVNELSSKSTFTSNLDYAYVSTEVGMHYNHFIPSLGIRYGFADNCVMDVSVGYSFFLFEHGPNTTGPYWNAGISYGFDHLTASLNTLVSYNTDPLRGSTETRTYSGRLDKTLSRGSAGINAGYSDLRDNLSGQKLSERFFAGANLKHDLTAKLSGHLDLTGEKVNDYELNNLNSDRTTPYRLYAAVGINYEMADKLNLTLDYSYTTYLKSIWSGSNNTEINRVILGVKKTF